jgi:hypothetical protein
MSTAAEQFTPKKGENAGKFQGKFSKPDDKVYLVFGKTEINGKETEVKLGTFNLPKRGNVMPNSKLYALITRCGVTGDNISDDLHELVGKTLEVVTDAKGFVKL